MRLINVWTHALEEFLDETQQKYAILSHRWGVSEISYGQMANPAQVCDCKGFSKIQGTCELAKSRGCDYVWIDTCCINKDSSAELSEAINSMFRWYSAACICYAFLSDVKKSGGDSDVTARDISKSQWFTRGWTLQELLAPPNMDFYDQDWVFLGTKQSLSATLSKTTGICQDVLFNDRLSNYSIAQRMSWASRRETPRKEDIAYCLLGMFDVNMPLLYGEGQRKAFLRLQEEIIRGSDDHTIFAWEIEHSGQSGLLADSPTAFGKCQSVKKLSSRRDHSPFFFTNRGLSIRLSATPYTLDTYLVRLDCMNSLLPTEDGDPDDYRLGMFLRRLYGDDQFGRIRHDGKTFVQVQNSAWTDRCFPTLEDDTCADFKYIGTPRRLHTVKALEINVRQDNDFSTTHFNERVYGFRFLSSDLFRRGRKTGKDSFSVHASQWDPEKKIISLKDGEQGTVGHLDIARQDRRIQIIKLGFDFDFNPICFIATPGGLDAMPGDQRRKASQSIADDVVRDRGIFHWSPFDELAWSHVQSGWASDLSHHPGLWAIKGDRLDGINVKPRELGNLQITRGMAEGKVIWDVHFDISVKERGWKRMFDY